jgi:hypothetical protein
MSTNVEVIHNPKPGDPSALLVKGPQELGRLYRWELGDCLASVALKYQRPSSDWKVLYALNAELFYKRHNRILTGDLIKIPEEWFPLKSTWAFDRTRIEETDRQNYQRESWIKEFYGVLRRYKDDSDAD